MSRVTENIGKKNEYRRQLRERRNHIQNILDKKTAAYSNEINFLQEQIDDINAL